MTLTTAKEACWVILLTLAIAILLSACGQELDARDARRQEAIALNSAEEDLRILVAQEKREAAEREKHPNGFRVRK